MNRKIVIIGGVAGGASAAVRVRRLDENATVIVIERGNDVSFANCGMPYFIGEEIETRSPLIVQSKETLQKRFRLDIRTKTEALRIDPKAHKVFLKDLNSGREYTEAYDKLILSPGASPIIPPIEGREHPAIFTLRDLGDMDRIKAKVDGAKTALIIGGGFIGLEMAENLHRRGLQVSLADLATQVMPPLDKEMTVPIQEELEAHKIRLYLDNTVDKFEDIGGRVRAHLKKGGALDVDLVIMAIGVRAESKLAKEAGLATASNGGIIVDERMRTSDADIHAVGDAVLTKHPVLNVPLLIALAGPANRQARVAADNICGKPSSYKGTQGTSIVRVFGISAGMTGASEKSLQQLKIPYKKILVHRAQHAGYFPGARQMAIKLLFAPDDGRVLGAQVVGGDGVDKRIDVFATAIYAGLTVEDLSELELAYAPPYGAARDPVNIAGYVATNELRGEESFIAPEELETSKSFLIDVREPSEYSRGHIPGAVNIPLGVLREKLGEVPKDVPLIVYCAVGQRGYYATRILRQNGFNPRNLMGGYTSYRVFEKSKTLHLGK